MPQGQPSALRDWVTSFANRDRYFRALNATVALADLAHGSSLSASISELAGRSILIATREQFTAGLALIELDGVTRRMILLPPDMRAEYLPAIISKAGVNAIATD